MTAATSFVHARLAVTLYFLTMMMKRL